MAQAALAEIEEVLQSASVDDIAEVLPRRSEPKVRALAPLPDMPKPPLPPALRGRYMPPDPFGSAAFGRLGTEAAEYSKEGAKEAVEGGKEVVGSGRTMRQRAAGAHKALGGVAKAATPVIAPVAAATLAGPAALPFLASAAAGLAAQKGTEAGLKAVGVPEEYAELAGDVAGLPGYTSATRRALPFLRSKAKSAAPTETAAISEIAEVVAKEAPKPEPLPIVTPSGVTAATRAESQLGPAAAAIPDRLLGLNPYQRALRRQLGAQADLLPSRITNPETPVPAANVEAMNQAAKVAEKAPPPMRSVSVKRQQTQKGALALPSKAEVKHGLRQKESEIFDRYAWIKDLEQKANIPVEESAYVGARSFRGQAGKAVNRLTDLRRIVRPAKKDGVLEDAIEYATLERHEELAGRLPGYVMPDNLTLPDVLAKRVAIEQKLGPDGMKKVSAFNDQLRKHSDDLLVMMRDEGVISKQAYQKIKADNQKYIPFQRVKMIADELERDSIPAGSDAFSVAGQNVVHAIKGSELEILDPLQALVRNTYRTISVVERNKIAKSMAAHAKRPEFKGVVMEIKPGQRAAQNFDTISYLDDGVKKQVAVPKEVGAAMKHLDEEGLDIVTRSLSYFARGLRAGVTLWPTFMARNVVRDYQTATAAARLKGAGFTPADWAYGFLSAVTRGIPKQMVPQVGRRAGIGDEGYHKFLESGGSFGGFYHRAELPMEASKLTEGAGVKVLKTVINPVELMRTIGETLELAPRIGVMRKAGKQGANLVEAGWKARNATVDFEKRGSAMRAVNAMVPFLNARIQGTLNLYGAIKEAPLATGMRLSAVAGMPWLLAYIHNRQQFPEEYDAIADYEKRANIVVVLGKERDDDGNLTNAIKIPKGEVGPYLNTLEDLVEYGMGKDKNFRKLFWQTASDLSPVQFEREGKPSAGAVASSVLPPPVKAAVELASGKNLYTGREVVPQHLKGATPKNQYRYSTPAPYRAAAQWLDKGGVEVSPLALQDATGTMFGYAGRAAADPSKVGEQIKKSLTGARTGSESSQRFERMRKHATEDKDYGLAVEREAERIIDEAGKVQGTERRAVGQRGVIRALGELAKQFPNTKPEQLREKLGNELEDLLDAKSEGLDRFERSLRQQPAAVRAKAIMDELGRLSPEKRSETAKRWREKKILTAKVEEALEELLTAGAK